MARRRNAKPAKKPASAAASSPGISASTSIPKAFSGKPPGVREYVIKAFLLEVERVEEPHEASRNPTWFSPEEARKILAKGREVKYARELQAVVDRAMEKIGLAQAATAR